MRCAGLLACLVLSCAASTTHAAPQSPKPSDATIYIIRQHAHPGMCTIDVVVDGRLAASVADHSFARFSVPAGRHSFTFRWPLLCTKDPVSAKVDIKGAQARYLVVTGTSRITGFYIVALGVKQTTEVSEVSPAEGERLIHELKR